MGVLKKVHFFENLPFLDPHLFWFTSRIIAHTFLGGLTSHPNVHPKVYEHGKQSQSLKNCIRMTSCLSLLGSPEGRQPLVDQWELDIVQS